MIAPPPSIPVGSPAPVREATAADLVLLAELERTCFGADAWSPGMLREELDRPGGIVLLGGEPPASYVTGWVVAGELHLLRIATRPTERRTGLASALHEELLRRAGTSADLAWLEVRADNAEACAFYARHGWLAVGRRPRYYGDGTDAVVMRLELGVEGPARP